MPGRSLENAVRVQQVHGIEIKTADWPMRSRVIPGADGLLTDKKGICLVVFTADCLPVFLISDDASATGLLHCGWRGLCRGIISESLRKEIAVKKLDPNRLTVIFGPSIGKCCYEVDSGFWQNFPDCRNERTFDLEGYARKQLADLGVKNRNIYSVNICSACRSDVAFSYRRTVTEDRMASFIYNGENYAGKT